MSPIRAILFSTFAILATPVWSVTLIEDGQPKCTIVVPREEGILVSAAEDLRYHLRKMSGAEVPIVHDTSKVEGVGIYIDTKPIDVHVPGRLYDRSLLWPDGYVIEVIQFDGKTGIFLSSPVSEGVRNAVYGILEDHLGCRWFTIGALGEQIPRRRTVTLNIPGNRDIAKPTFEKRSPWYNGNANLYLTKEEIAELNKWYRRNRRGEPRGTAGHGWNLYKVKELNQIDDDGDGVSDLTPVVNGKRDPAQTGNGLCMSHPKAVDIAAKWFIEFFNGRPEFDHWSFSQGDSMQFCECERCAAFGSNHGAHMLIMSNQVIERVNKVHPEKRITILPYQATLEPPREQIQANPNLNPIIVSMGVDQVLPKPESPNFRRQVKRWMTMLPRAWSYDYISWMSAPWPLFQALEKTRDFYIEAGYSGVMDEYLGRNLGTDIHLWLSLKLAWNGDLRVKDLLDEFYPSYYGAAAQDVRGVYERIEKNMHAVGPVSTSRTNIPRLYPPKMIDECLADVARAKRKVRNDSTLVARVERDENCLKALQLWLRYWTTLGEANRKFDREARKQAARACRAYLDFFKSLNGTLTFGGGGMHLTASRMISGLESQGTYFTKRSPDQPWPGGFRYYDFLDEGGKVTDAQSVTGFFVGPFGLYLKPNTTGEIIYDLRTTEDLMFAEAFFPGPQAGYQVALALALTDGGHNKIEVSLDQGKTWNTAYEDLDTSIPFYQHDLTSYVHGRHQFLLKFTVKNGTDKEILAFDKWVIGGKTEKKKKPREHGALNPNDRYNSWQKRHPFTQTAWQTHRYSGGEKADLAYFHGSGLNTFFDGVRSGAERSKHPISQGLPALVMVAAGNKPENLPKVVADFEDAQKAHSNLIGVILQDEVQAGAPAKFMRLVRDWIVNHEDPKISSLITVASVSARVPTEHWDEIYQTIKPDAWLVQHYPFGEHEMHDASGYYVELERFFRWTRANHTPLWIYTQTYAGHKNGIPSESELRLQRFTSLAYGARGFSDFMWGCTPPSIAGAGYWDGSGKPTLTYKLVSPINREVAAIAKSLIRLTPTAAYHLDQVGKRNAAEVRHWIDRDTDLPTWRRRTGALANVTGALNRNHLLVGFFRDVAGEEYFLVVNKSNGKRKTGDDLATEVILTFRPEVTAIERLRRTDGIVEEISVDRHHAFSLPGGTGDLFKVATGAAFAGVESPVVPKLAGATPEAGGTLPRLERNRIALHFDEDARNVGVEIRQLDENDKAIGDNLAKHFQRSLTKDGRTVVYEESGAVLSNGARYRVTTHWATGEPFTLRALRGDVDGDGEVGDRDVASVQSTAQRDDTVESLREDLDADGSVGSSDLVLVKKLAHPPPRFRWADGFDEYPTGPLTGQGSWLEVESLPASIFTKALVTGPATVTRAAAELEGPQKISGGPYPNYKGNEGVFHTDGGFGETGLLRCGYRARLGNDGGVQRVSFHIANSNDTEGKSGAIHCQILNTAARVFTTRDVDLIDPSDGTNGDVFKEVSATQGSTGKGVTITVLVNFDLSSLTWQLTDEGSGKLHGPHTVHYRGKFKGLDSLSFWVCGQDAHVDEMWVQNY